MVEGAILRLQCSRPHGRKSMLRLQCKRPQLGGAVPQEMIHSERDA